MLPALEVRFRFGAVTSEIPLTSLMLPEAMMLALLLAVSAAPKVTVLPATVFACSVTSYPETAAEVERLPPVALTVNALPTRLPAAPSKRLIVPAAVSMTEVMADEVAVTVMALVAAIATPPAPPLATRVGVVSVPVALMAPLVAFSVIDVDAL